MKHWNAASADEAARRFVRADAGERGADAALAAWLEERPGHEIALQRVELAVALAHRLAAEPGSALHAEAAAAARLPPRRSARRVGLAWGGALAASAVVALFVLRLFVPPAHSPDTAPLEAARFVTFDAPSNAVAVLPAGVVVDAGAVAVLPFVGSVDATLAHGLERDVVASLRTVPGLYIIAGDAVRPYANTDLAAAEIGSQLGVRGLVDADVELADGRVRVSARLRETATGATVWQAEVDRPVDELGALRNEIAERIAATLLDSGLREQLAREARASAPVSYGKPILQ